MITGGAQGLGEGIARRAAAEGASIVIADRNGELAKSVAASLKSAGAKRFRQLLMLLNAVKCRPPSMPPSRLLASLM